MRYGRLRLPDGTTHWARLDDGVARLLDGPPWAEGHAGARVELTGATVLAPVVPTKVVAFARTYPKHAAELGNAVPEEPKLFLKPPSAVIGPDVAIRLPADVGRCDPEGEVALVIGKRLTDATPDQARAAVLGVTALNDVSARDLQQRDGVWGRAKGFDTFCPIGPWIETEVDPSDLGVSTSVNGVIRAQGRTSHMTWDPYALVAWASRIMTLEPGDVVTTGTPPGVAPLQPGDLVEVAVEGVGVLRNPVTAR